MLTNLRVEYKTTPLGMDEPRPRFSWETSQNRQSTYRITVKAGDVLVWDSGEVASPRTTQVEYEGATLQCFTRYDWSVATKGEDGETLEASSYFETGYMGTKWTAPWIQPITYELRPTLTPVRTVFQCGAAASARLCITALGIFQAYLNEKRVTEEDLLPPGFTQYDKRVQYRVYDIGGLLRDGENQLEVLLGCGWFSGNISRIWNGFAPTWGKNPLIRAEMRLVQPDGAVEVIPVDAGNTKACRFTDQADIYDGTIVEAWHKFALNNPGEWKPIQEVDFANPPKLEGKDHLNPSFIPKIVWSCSEPVAHIRDVRPVSITKRSNGAYIVDFGQNLVGRERFTLRNNIQGTIVTIRHGEMLRDDGSLYYDNLRQAIARTVYVSGTAETETFEPELTFYGFRYLDVTGWPGELTADDILARVIHTDLPLTGSFSSDHKMLNQLQSNILWGQRSNFVDIPTDCPQRDERLGWTGDTQVFADEATWNMDAAAFYTKWLADLNAGQSVNGSYAHYAPSPYNFIHAYEYDGATGWGDAGIVCPWVMLEKYGDTRIVKKYMPQMLRWLDWEIERSNDTYILDVAKYQDWLYIGWQETTENMTPKDFISSAYLAGMLRLTARMLHLIGDDAEAAHRMRQYQEARKAVQGKFLDAQGAPLVRTQTGLLMALEWDLFEPASAAIAADLLVKNIRDINDTHLTTGFLGTPLLLQVLTKIGQSDLAYDLLLQTTYPGWLYPITQGATTMWERWNSYTKDKGFGNVGMNSFNHYAYGAVGAWFYRT
ncbi:MAG: family 78 glycoside hydrolase catalytic domain, partial [Victivallales bacterium]|nr:family 78 glycoside hydrolase catalytic domain [Victivallales bacterium]